MANNTTQGATSTTTFSSDLQRDIDSPSGYDVYSGADIQAIVHIPPDFLNKKAAVEQEDIDYYESFYRARGIELPEDFLDTSRAIDRVSKPAVLGDIQTLSYSIYREKYPVRTLGMGYPKGFCLPESAKILVKDRGYISIKNVLEGDMVQSGPGIYNKVTGKYVQDDTKECYKLKVSDGYEIEGSYDHPVMTDSGWKPIGEVQIGDDISVCGVSPCEDEDYAIPDEMITMIAYLIGDGTTHKYDDTYRIGLSIADKEMDSIGKETEQILNKYNISFRDNKKNDDKCITRVISVCVEGHAKTDHRKRKYNLLHKLLLEHDLYGRYSHTKIVPNKLLSKMSRRQAILFLNRIFSTDGCYSVSHDKKYIEARYCSTSEALVDEIRVLLNKLGILALKSKEDKVGKVGGRPNIISRHDSFHLTISNCKDLVKFVSIVGIYGKQDRIASLVHILKRRIKHDSLSTCMIGFRKKVSKILFDRNKGRKKNAGVKDFCTKYNLYNSALSLTPRRAYMVADALKDKALSEDVERQVDALIFSDKEYICKSVIKKENTGEQIVYDLTVDFTESFVSNFMHVHNTRGPRTISGTMIFTMFNKQVLYDLMKRIVPDTSNDLSTPLIDQLPRFDVTVTFANEYGSASTLVIYGVEIISEGITMSIDDFFTENVVQYIAQDIRPMLPDKKTSKKLQTEIALSASDLMMRKRDEERMKTNLKEGLTF